jgi:hypothetical protein
MYGYSSFSAPLLKYDRKGAAQKAAYVEVPNQAMSFMNRKKHPLGFYVKGYVDQVRYTMQKLEQQADGSWIFPISASILIKAKKNSGDEVNIAMDKDRLSFPMTDAFMVVFFKEPQEVRNYYHSHQMSDVGRNLYNEWVYRARNEAERKERIARAIEGLRNKLGFEAMKRATRK